MDDSRPSPLIRAVSIVLTLAILNLYAGGPLYAASFKEQRRIRQHNAEVLRNLGVTAALTDDAIAARKSAARLKIQQTRSKYIAQQAQAQRDNARIGGEIRAEHLAQRLDGMVKRVSELQDLIADLRDGRDIPLPLASSKLDLYRDTLKLQHRWLTDETVRELSFGPDVDPSLTGEVAERIQAVLDAMSPLPADPTRATHADVAAVVKAVGDVAQAYHHRRAENLGKGSAPDSALPYDALRGDIVRPPPKPPGSKGTGERRDPRSTDELFALFGDRAIIPPDGNLRVQAPPTTDDLEAGPDVRISAAVQALAAELGGDPLAIYNYVVNNIDYVPYHGSRDGSEGALSHGYGNDADIASLLIALYRASGIPARYEYGTAEIQPEDTISWLAVDTPATATTMLASEGVPVVGVYSGSGLQFHKIERVWVKAFVPYTNYRGNTAGLGDGGDGQWVTLDPAWKMHKVVNRVDVREAVAFDVPSYVVREPSISPMDHVNDAVNGYLADEGLSCPNLEDAHHTSKIIPQNFELLPTTLPYPLASDPVSASELPSSLRYSLQVQTYDNYGFVSMSHTVTMPELFGKRMALTFPSSSSTLDSSLSGYTSPTLSIDDVKVASGGSVQSGEDTLLVLRITQPGQSPYYRDHEPVAGGSYVINLEFGHVNPARIEALEAEIASLKNSGATQGAIDRRIGHLAGLRWSERLYRDDVALFGMAGYYHSALYESLTGAQVVAKYFFGLPNGATRDGYGIDAQATHFGAPRYGAYDEPALAQLVEDAGWTGSYWEHAMWGSVVNSYALSTTNILQNAYAQGQNIYYLNSWDEYQAVRSELSHGSRVISGVESNLQAGGKVVIHQRTLNYQGRSMSGYLLNDPATGSGQYLIYDEVGGGQTSASDPYGIIIGLAQCIVAIFSDLNASSGNLVLTYADMNTSLAGPEVLLGRTYNSTDEEVSEFGYGWSFSFGDRLLIDDDITWVSPTGERRVFTSDGSGGWDRPNGWYGRLAAEGPGYALTTEDDEVYRYDSAGVLLSRADKAGNTVTINRNGAGEITTVSDDEGRDLYSFTYEDGKVTEVSDVGGRTSFYSYDGDDLISYTGPTDDTWTYTYYAGGLLGEVRGPDGKSVRYSFDANRRLVQYSDDAERMGFFAYDDVNNRSAHTHPDGATKIYTFDDNGRCLSITNESGVKTENHYDSEGNMTGYTNGRGETTTVELNENGDVETATTSDGDVIEVTYDGEGRQTAVTSGGEGSTWDYNDSDGSVTVNNANGTTNSYTYDERGQVSGIAREDGTNVTVTTDSATGLISGFEMAEPGGETSTTTLTLDPLGRVTSFSAADGDEMVIGWDGGSHMSSMTNGEGESVLMDYDSRGHLAELTDPAGRTQTYTWDYDFISTSTDFDGRTTSFGYDSRGRNISMTNPYGKTSTYTWDLASRLVGQTDERGNSTELGYCADLVETPCDVIDPFGNLIQREFDEDGRVISETSSLGTLSWSYNDIGQLTSMTNRAGDTRTYTYDENRRLQTVTDEENNTSTFGWDSRGRLTTVTDAEGHTTTYTYNGLGQMASVTDAEDRTTTFTYGFAGQRSGATYPDGSSYLKTFNHRGQVATETFKNAGGVTTLERVFTYNLAGDLIRVQTGDTDMVFARDGDGGRLSSVGDADLGEEVSFTWNDITGQPATQVRPDGTQRYTYDPYGELATLTTPDGKTFRYVWDDFGRVQNVRYPNGVVETRSYDEFGRLAARYYEASTGEIVAGAGYTYDIQDRLATQTDHLGQTTTYNYDKTGQLTGVDGPDGLTTYEYDKVGNRVKVFEDGALVESCTFDDSNRLTSCDRDGESVSFTYDARGNVIQEGTGPSARTFTYDEANQLTSASGPSGTTTYTYDGLGRLHTQTRGGEARTFLYDGMHIIAEFVDGALSRSYIRAPGIDQLIAFRDHDENKSGYFHQDGMLNVVALSDASGNVTTSYRYSAFGEVLEETGGSANRMMFAGRLYDAELKRYHVRARVLDPASGRFMQADPYNLATAQTQRTGLAAQMTANLGESPQQMLMDPLGRNGYAFARNSPLNYWDPSGENQILFYLVVALGLALATAASGLNLWPLIYANYKATNKYVELISFSDPEDFFESVASFNFAKLYLHVWKYSLSQVTEPMGEELISTANAATFNIQGCGGDAEDILSKVEDKLIAWSGIGKIPVTIVTLIFMAYFSYFLLLSILMIWLFQMPGFTVNVPIQCNCED